MRIHSRTHTCGELRIEDVGKEVTLCGWLNNVRDLGGTMFFVLRDFYGVTQAAPQTEKLKEQIRKIPRESTVRVTGKVIARSAPNPAIPTGLVEIIPSEIEVMGLCSEALPFEISHSLEQREDTRLKYRFLDMRNPIVKDKLVLRSKVAASIRRRMVSEGFVEITTPILTSSSPEGARDFIVPSRLYPGEFYALPQAPQQFKQLLMAGGIDRYFQIAPCFRDEDARADRSPGEFYQLDLEMAFASQEDVFGLIETVFVPLFREFSTKTVVDAPFERIKYKDAIDKYGTDKPDLRNPLIIKDATKLFIRTKSPVPFFEKKTVKAVVCHNFNKSRSFIDKDLIETAKQNEIETLYWFKVDDSGAAAGGISKFLLDSAADIIKELQLKPGSFVALVAGEDKDLTAKQAGLVRTILGNGLNLIDKTAFRFCWIIDYPMYEKDDSGKIAFSHNPFSMPQGGAEVLKSAALKRTNPLEILAYQYDLVCNGVELSSGAVRNHDPDIMIAAFKLAGYGEEEIKTRFSALFNAFKFGAPPHAGIAPGFDRIVMLLSDEPNIREIIAFPMNKNARDLLMSAPSPISEAQLCEANIKTRSEN